MFLPVRELKSRKIKTIEDDFGKAAEAIMQCGDFKSNFARRLSNRHIAKPSDTFKRESEFTCKLSLKRSELESTKENVADNQNFNEVSREDGKPLIPKSPKTGCGSPKLQDPAAAPAPRQDMHHTEVAALNTEIDMLRWQLKQTEANRQMHIALLEQVVSFLHRVKEHMNEGALASYTGPELPRSRSVFHVNNAEYTMSPVNKMASKKMSKSITNVNGFHRPEFSATRKGSTADIAWKQSKLSFLEETNCNKKVLEELSRLISLADTVLTTKLPHLSCCVVDEPQTESLEPPPTAKNVIEQDLITQEVNSTENAKEELDEPPVDNETFKNTFILNTSTSVECSNGFDGITNKYIETRDCGLDKYMIPASPLTCGLEDDFAPVSLDTKCDSFSTSLLSESKKNSNLAKKEKKIDPASAGIEDESGFSSMSSFQEIGIPIINVIPPTPSKEVAFLSEAVNLIPSEETWKSELIDLDKQNMKVFWV